MTNLDQAEKAIKFGAARGYTPEGIATLLRELELLAPDLPEPDYSSKDPNWQAEYQEDYGYPAPDIWRVNSWFSVGVFPEDDTITIWYDGLPLDPFTIDEVKKLRQALHAAERTAKEQA